jgi:hypothetical protein
MINAIICSNLRNNISPLGDVTNICIEQSTQRAPLILQKGFVIFSHQHANQSPPLLPKEDSLKK